jgi:hypothetical protein
MEGIVLFDVSEQGTRIILSADILVCPFSQIAYWSDEQEVKHHQDN